MKERTDQYRESARRILEKIGTSTSITFIRGFGNIGDDLIYAGARKLLSVVDYQEKSLTDVAQLNGDVGLVAGSGAFCGTYPQMTRYLPEIEKRFERVIVLPSSFDLSIPAVRSSLTKSKTFFFAREERSFGSIRDICECGLAHDTAFYFDFSPYRRRGSGILNAFRIDKEASGRPVPPDNNDISATCETLDEWLWTIARHEHVRTDRAHVMIAGALLGKTVEYASSNYHKVPAIAQFSLGDLPVSRLPDTFFSSLNRVQHRPAPRNESSQSGEFSKDRQELAAAGRELAELCRPGHRFVLVDDGQVLLWPLVESARVPFLERDGQFWGPPADDQTAICELQRLRNSGATLIAFTWHAFWWLDHYKGFVDYLRSTFPCAIQNRRLVVFNLEQQKSLVTEQQQNRSYENLPH
jgi:exopolysaccharide biosynthesis predicted pyruvyltransferase EpsI